MLHYERAPRLSVLEAKRLLSFLGRLSEPNPKSFLPLCVVHSCLEVFLGAARVKLFSKSLVGERDLPVRHSLSPTNERRHLLYHTWFVSRRRPGELVVAQASPVAHLSLQQ